MRVLGDPGSSGRDDWTPAFDNAPFLYDLDGDGTHEIIGHGMDRKVYVFRADGRLLATLSTTYPPAWHVERVLNGVEAGVLQEGEPPSIVVTNHAAYVSAWRYDARASGRDHMSFEKVWEHRMDGCRRNSAMDAKPTLADLDGDPDTEILVQTEQVGLYALDANGSELWRRCWAGGNSAPVAADIDGDGSAEAVFASDSGVVSVLHGAKGSPRWTFDAKAHGVSPGSIVQSPTVANLDGQGRKEVLFVARHATSEDAETFRDQHMAVFALQEDPTTYQVSLRWMRQPEWANPMSNTRLIVEDVDGDGRGDIFGQDWNTIGHFPGEWERLGPAHVFRLDAEGQDVWVREIDAGWSNHDLALGDADGDGTKDLLVNGPVSAGDGLWRLSAADGTAEGYLALSPWTMLRGAVVAPLRPNGPPHLFIPAEDKTDGSPRGGILVYELS